MAEPFGYEEKREEAPQDNRSSKEIVTDMWNRIRGKRRVK